MSASPLSGSRIGPRRRNATWLTCTQDTCTRQDSFLPPTITKWRARIAMATGAKSDLSRRKAAAGQRQHAPGHENCAQNRLVPPRHASRPGHDAPRHPYRAHCRRDRRRSARRPARNGPSPRDCHDAGTRRRCVQDWMWAPAQIIVRLSAQTGTVRTDAVEPRSPPPGSSAPCANKPGAAVGPPRANCQLTVESPAR